MSEYHKIETLYERDDQTHRLREPLVLKNRVYGLLKSWRWTEKIDGTNIRCIWRDGRVAFAGKTDRAQLHAELVDWLRLNVTADKMQDVFPGGKVVIYGEGYGAGIQKGGGYSSTKQLIVFDVAVFSEDGHCWWLSDENVSDVCFKLGLNTVPNFGDMTLETATVFVRQGFVSRLGGGTMQAEGIVGRPLEALFDKKGHRLIVKLKTKDFG